MTTEKRNTGTTTRIVINALMTGKSLSTADLLAVIKEKTGTDYKSNALSNLLYNLNKKSDLGFFLIREKMKGRQYLYSFTKELLQLSEEQVFGLSTKIGKDRYTLEQALVDFPELGKYVDKGKGKKADEPAKDTGKTDDKDKKPEKVADDAIAEVKPVKEDKTAMKTLPKKAVKKTKSDKPVKKTKAAKKPDKMAKSAKAVKPVKQQETPIDKLSDIIGKFDLRPKKYAGQKITAWVQFTETPRAAHEADSLDLELGDTIGISGKFVDIGVAGDFYATGDVADQLDGVEIGKKYLVTARLIFGVNATVHYIEGGQQQIVTSESEMGYQILSM